MRFFTLLSLLGFSSMSFAQFQMGAGSGVSMVSKTFKVFQMDSDNLLLKKTENLLYPSFFIDAHFKNIGIGASYTDGITGLTIDYNKLIIDNILNIGLGIGVLTYNPNSIENDYYDNYITQKHDAVSLSEFDRICPQISAHCDLRIYRNFKTRLTYTQSLGRLGYKSTSEFVTLNTNWNVWIGETSSSRSPNLSVTIYYSIEEKKRGPLIIDPKPSNQIRID
jgi:hypothetical protein